MYIFPGMALEFGRLIFFLAIILSWLPAVICDLSTLPSTDDECGVDDAEACVVNQLQRRAMKVASADAVEDETSERWAGSCKSYGCRGHYHSYMKCQCNSKCAKYGNCCNDYYDKCTRHSQHPGHAPAPPPDSTSSADHSGTQAPQHHGHAPAPPPNSTSPANHSGAPAPFPQYSLDWVAEGKSFFDGWKFLWKDDNHGSAEYLLKDAALKNGVAQAYDTHAIITAGKASPKYKWKRQTAKIESYKSWKHFLVAMKYTHLPYGCGVWPAFFTLGTKQPWPKGGEFDILEYVNMDVSKSSVHMGAGCTLSPQAVNKFGNMPDRNKMDYNCLTDYGQSKLGCAPNKWMKTGQQWSQQPGVVALEWTDEHIKIFAIPASEVPRDLESNRPNPENWDRWLFSYYPLLESGCSSDLLDPQKLLMQINFCGDWASKVWHLDGQCKHLVHGCRSVDALMEYAPQEDCCTKFTWDESGEYGTDNYLKTQAYFNITYLKVFSPRHD